MYLNVTVNVFKKKKISGNFGLLIFKSTLICLNTLDLQVSCRMFNQINHIIGCRK